MNKSFLCSVSRVAIMGVTFFGLMLLVLQSGLKPAFAREDITINGSTTVLPIIQKAAEAYMHEHPSVAISVSGGGSGNGIKALLDGLTQIAMSSRDLKDSEIKQAEEKKISPLRIPVGVDAMLPVVNPANPVTSLTLEQLKEIYKGNIKNWKEVGGNDAKIVVISRDTSSGTYESWEELVMKQEKVMPGALLQASNGAVVQNVSGNKNAIGYVGLGYLSSVIKKLNIGDLEATTVTALSGEWPISRMLFLFTNGELEGAAGDFIAFVRDPQKGQKLVEEIGFIPLPMDKR